MIPERFGSITEISDFPIVALEFGSVTEARYEARKDNSQGDVYYS